MARKWSRISRLGTLTTRISSSYVGQRIRGAFQDEEDRSESLHRLHLDNASRIVDAMSHLKGAAMKVGQSVAVMAESLELSDEVQGLFSRLNDQAAPIPFEQIRRVLESEYERPLEEIFAEIDPEPLGTASLAQAHAGRLISGRSIVVKVLHEGVEHSVDTDLLALKSIMLAGRLVKRTREEIDLIFDEIRERLLEELDYLNEAENLRRFHPFISQIEGVESPLPVDELCTKRVLVMDRLLGMNLETFCNTASPEAKQRAGDRLAEVFHKSAYVFRAIHADPHGGNYLFRSDGRVALIDFGCVKRFSLQFIHDYSILGNSILDDDRDGLIRIAREMGMLVSEDPESAAALWNFAQGIRAPFDQRPFQCGGPSDSLAKDVRKLGKGLLLHQDIRPPRDIIFLHRALMGTYSMLCRFGHQANYEDIRRKYADIAIDVASGDLEDLGWS